MSSTARLFAALLPLAASACTSPTVRDGIWKLSFVDTKMARKVNQRMDVHPYPMDDQLVRVKLGVAEEGEVLEITRLDPPPPQGDAAVEGEAPPVRLEPLTALYADVKRTHEDSVATTVHIDGADRYWIWRMWGTVTNPETITGSTLSAFRRFESTTILEGRWLMKWLREG
jgi:hypothetical protein